MCAGIVEHQRLDGVNVCAVLREYVQRECVESERKDVSPRIMTFF